MLYSNPRKCQYLCSQHLQACSFDCHRELPSEQRSRKRRRLNFMATEQKKDDRENIHSSMDDLHAQVGNLGDSILRHWILSAREMMN